MRKEWEVLALATIIDNIDDAVVVVDCTGRISFFNTAAQRLVGFKGDPVGKDVSEVIPNTRLPEVLRTGRAELNQAQKLTDKSIITNRFPVRGPSSEVVGAVAIFRDISEVKTLREQISSLQEIRTLLNEIFNSTRDAISVVDETGKGILINPAYTQITGFTEADVINKPATVDIAEGESVHLKVLQTRQPILDVPMKVGPARKEVIVTCSPLIVDGKLRGSVGVIHDVSELRRLSEELERAKRLIRRLEAKYTFADIIGDSELMQNVVDQAKRAALTPVTVLLRGESGTGKELFAHAIHHASNRGHQPFIRVNCAALHDNLLESELFGYEEGAFTGARRGGKNGLFEEADGGTLFLDEIGELGFALQSKLLRVLQEREIVRVGGHRAIPVNVRIIAATNANLEEKLKQGAFRVDLYYRLNVLPIIVPPLRQRRSDIAALAAAIIRKFNQEFGRCVQGIDPDALLVLQDYPWPGNVRELENILGRAIINMRTGENVIEKRHLPGLTGQLMDNRESGGETEERSYMMQYAAWEKDLLRKTLLQTGGNKTRAAQLLHISVRNFYYKLNKHGLLDK